ncbi:LemA family protein [Patescibacteria group bacterium]|nr:LemA family protein [Patescibacteria group bacterium]
MYILLAIIAIVVIALVGIYNGLVKKRARTDEAWADIDVQLKRRYDLIPNLVETVKGYATHERATLDEVLEARSKATQMTIDPSKVSADQMAQFASLESGLTSALGKLLAVAEAYPDLKANQNFLELQRELTDTENKIQAARRFYNTNVRDLNIAIETFPSNMVAGSFGFTKREFFELEGDSKEREPIVVSFRDEA